MAQTKIYLAKNLKHLRKKMNCTCEQMAKICRLGGKSSYFAYENDVAFPPIPILIKLAEAFEYSIDDLILKDLTQKTT